MDIRRMNKQGITLIKKEKISSIGNQNCCALTTKSFKKDNKLSREKSNELNSTGKNVINYLGGAFSVILMILIPKCPMCLAGYIALGTGISISFITASYVKIFSITTCIMSLVFIILKRIKVSLLIIPKK
jgi:hypothetical protein